MIHGPGKGKVERREEDKERSLVFPDSGYIPGSTKRTDFGAQRDQKSLALTGGRIFKVLFQPDRNFLLGILCSQMFSPKSSLIFPDSCILKKNQMNATPITYIVHGHCP